MTFDPEAWIAGCGESFAIEWTVGLIGIGFSGVSTTKGKDVVGCDGSGGRESFVSD